MLRKRRKGNGQNTRMFYALCPSFITALLYYFQLHRYCGVIQIMLNPELQKLWTPLRKGSTKKCDSKLQELSLFYVRVQGFRLCMISNHVHRVLGFSGFQWCGFHLCAFSKNSPNIQLMQFSLHKWWKSFKVKCSKKIIFCKKTPKKQNIWSVIINQ